MHYDTPINIIVLGEMTSYSKEHIGYIEYTKKLV